MAARRRLERTRKRPSHKLTGIGRSTSLVLRERAASRKWTPAGHPCPLSMQRSTAEPLAFESPGPTGIAPVQSSATRSQDGPPCRHRISASFRTLPSPPRALPDPSTLIVLGRWWSEKCRKSRSVGAAVAERRAAGHQWLRWTTSSKGRRSGLTIGRSGRSAGYPNAIM